jgi:energy-coupling factor transport system permease protein
MHTLPRWVHPGAWWLWAIGLAVAVSMTTNPLLLGIALAVAALVVSARRGDSPWARAFRLYLYLGAFIIGVRIVLHVLVGLKFGEHVLLPLPSVRLPSWAAGINLGGTVRLEGLLAAICEGLRLATMIACVGAANALANPKRLLRALPGALHEIGSAVVVSVTVAPQLAESVQRVMRARELRGDVSRGLRALPRVALPVLEDTLERSLVLASAMDARGYGRHAPTTRLLRTATGVATLSGLLLATLGLYGVLDASSPAWLGGPTLATGLLLVLAGIGLAGRSVSRSRYRPDPWRAAEWLTVLCGAAAAGALLWVRRQSPDALTLPLTPLAVPALPLVAVGGLLAAALPAFLTPEPPAPPDRTPRRGAA